MTPAAKRSPQGGVVGECDRLPSPVRPGNRHRYLGASHGAAGEGDRPTEPSFLRGLRRRHSFAITSGNFNWEKPSLKIAPGVMNHHPGRRFLRKCDKKKSQAHGGTGMIFHYGVPKRLHISSRIFVTLIREMYRAFIHFNQPLKK